MSGRVRSGALALVLSALILLAIPYSWRFSILETSEFDPDEFQHLHSAWCISQGMLPYRDYFEHHTPWMHFLTAPLFGFYNVERSADSALDFIFIMRRLVWVCTGVILALVFALGRCWRDWRVGLVAAVLLLNEQVFLTTTLEIRPDLLSVPLLLASLWALLAALRSGSSSGLFLGSGALLGASIMFTQKSLFAGPPLALIGLWHVLDPRSGPPLPGRVRNLALFTLGACAPPLLTAGYFASQHGLAEFIDCNILVNLGWKERFSPLPTMLECLEFSPVASALAVAGFARSLPHLFGRESVQRGDHVVPLAFAGLWGGAFVMPAPWAQYHLLYLPLGALLAASCLVDGVEALANLRAHGRSWPWTGWLEGAATAALLAGLIHFALSLGESEGFRPSLQLVIWTAALGLAGPLALAGARNWALAALLPALAAWPLQQLSRSAPPSNQHSLRQLRFVIENSRPEDTVLDGWTSRAPFRPHAYRNYVLNGEHRSLHGDQARQQFLLALYEGRIAPRLILLDDDLKEFCPAAVPFYEENYRPTEVPPIWIHK